MTDKILIDRAVVEQALDALTCPSRYSVPGHRCSHCDNDVDRNGLVRTALRAALEHVVAIDATEKRVEKTVENEHKPVAWATIYMGRPTQFFKNDDAEKKARAEIERLNREYPQDGQKRYAAPLYTHPPAAPEQEPVAWMHRYIDCNFITHRPADLDKYPTRWIPLYEYPPRREWVGLTPEEIDSVMPYCPDEFDLAEFKDFAQAIEAKLKEKNT